MNTKNNIKSLIIIPCYNEEIRLDTISFYQFASNNPNIHFLFVDDGSTDNTSFVLKKLCNQLTNLDFIKLNKNVGKGNAIRRGVLTLKDGQTKFEYIGYLDADLAVPVKELNNFLKILKNNKNIKFILGSRVARFGANIKRNFIRHYIGRTFATLVSLMLKEVVYDTQCGAKLLHQSIAYPLFKDKFISNWLFDIELITRCKMIFPNYGEMLYEHPLAEWQEKSGSKIKITSFLSAPYMLALIWTKYRKFL